MKKDYYDNEYFDKVDICNTVKYTINEEGLFDCDDIDNYSKDADLEL